MATERNIWHLGQRDDSDWWDRNVGSMSPFEVVEQANGDRLELDEWVDQYLAAWPFPEPAPDDAHQRLIDILARAANAEVARLEALRDELGLGYDALGPVDCVAVAFDDSQGYYVGDDSEGDHFSLAKDAEDALSDWAAMVLERADETAEQERLYALEATADLAE